MSENKKELLNQIISESYRQKKLDEESIGMYRTAINRVNRPRAVSQESIDKLLNFLRGRFSKVVEDIDLYLKK